MAPVKKASVGIAEAQEQQIAGIAAAIAAVLVRKEDTNIMGEINLLKLEVAHIKEQQESFEGSITKKFDELVPQFDKIFCKLDGRPSWGITFALGGLCSLCGILITYIVSTLK